MSKVFKGNILDLSIDEFNTRALLAVSSLRDVNNLHTQYRSACFDKSRELLVELTKIQEKIRTEATSTQGYDSYEAHNCKQIINSALDTKGAAKALQNLACSIEEEENYLLLRCLLLEARAEQHFSQAKWQRLIRLSLSASGQTELLTHKDEIKREREAITSSLYAFDRGIKVNSAKLADFFI